MNKVRASVQKQDPRVQRTRHVLGAALVELMVERPFEEITVQNVLERARVGRATFYSHFRNKDDLFLSDYEKMLDGMEARLVRTEPASRRVAPVAELCTHLGEMGPLLRALRASGHIDLVWQIGAEHFTRMIERRLRSLSRRRHVVDARFCAGALVEMLKWWLDRDERPSPVEMDLRYHEMVWKAIG